MHRLRVQDVMTRDVVSVSVGASFKEVARRLEENDVSALPVIDELRQLVGVVSEADLLPKEEYRETASKPRRLARWRRRNELAKAGGQCARELMSAPAVTISQDATLAEAARQMSGQRVKRLPVVDPRGALVGIVSRSDLVDTFLRPDAAIAEQVRAELGSRVLLTEIGHVDVAVAEGVVTLTGHLDRKSTVMIAERVARSVAAVVSVKNDVTFTRDDSKAMR